MTNQHPIVQELHRLEDTFTQQNAYGLGFKNECLFAKQQLLKNDFTMKTAENNQGSLRSAILNVAAIGITLNPAMAHAYLVPRDGQICLDISWRGLVKLATDSGAIEWAKAVLVYEGDRFTWRGVNQEPIHEADVLDPNRMDAKNPLENLKGGYCIAKLPDGSFLTDFMTAAEILEVRNTSKAKKGPWAGPWAGEMAKKTLVKRASKSWPQSNGRERLDTAIEVLNAHEGLEELAGTTSADWVQPSPEQTEKFMALSQAGETMELALFVGSLPLEVRQSLPGIEFPHGEKIKMRKLFDAQIAEGREQFDEYLADLTAACDSTDDAAVLEIMLSFSEEAQEHFYANLRGEHGMYVREVLKEEEPA